MSNQKRTSSSFLLVFMAGLLAMSGLWRCKDSKSAPPGNSGSETTLTASSPRLELLTPEATGIDFQNLVVETPENNITNNINIYNGGGVAIADINNDGLQDIYFVCANGKNKMYLNLGNMKFKDITDASGLGSEDGFETAVTAVDINNDGFLDFYVCRGGPEPTEGRRNKLYVNNGNLTFTEKAKEYGIDDISACTGAAFFDYDLDGDLDLYLINYPTDISWATKIDAQPGPDGKPVPNTLPKKPYDSDRLYRNDGGKYTDVSKEAGIWNFDFSLSVSISDFNHDGYPDVYVGNDFIHPDKMYINNRNGTFTDHLADFVKHTSMHTMGTDISDFDNDGEVDIFGLDMMPRGNYRDKTIQPPMNDSRYLSFTQAGYFEPVIHNVLQHNNGNGTFSEIACMADVYNTDWSWSGLMADLNNDGLKDLHVTNGYRREITNLDFFEFEMDKLMGDLKSGQKSVLEALKVVPEYKMRNLVFENQGNWRFKDKSGDWMTMKGTWSCGAAWADLDNDGDLELIVSNMEEPAMIYKNLTREKNDGNYLQLKFGPMPSNSFAVGASALIESGGQRQYCELNPTRGIFSSVEHLLHFGLGKATAVDKLTVRWPDGKTQTFTNVPANQRIQLKYQDASGHVASLVTDPAPGNLFKDITAGSGVHFQHKENSFVDFESFPLIPWKETDLGPALAKGDVNGDGQDDFFVGNAYGSPAALYIQGNDGHFSASSEKIWEADKAFEEHGAVFFDADGDGDLDLFVVSGGAECVPDGRKQAFQGRVYINTDGKGNFVKSPKEYLLPDIQTVGLRVTAYDYDQDGDDDLFIGGRIVPDKWPTTPRSLVLRNDRKKLTDVTAFVAGDFENCGMVTDLQWADLDGDHQPELIAVGEWMPVTIFQFYGGKLKNVTTQFGLDKSNGIWYRLALADLDGDGDLDLVTGNMGLNTRFKATAEGPMRCFAKDFDKNNTLDPILTLNENGKDYPFFSKNVLNKQMPSLKKKVLYAKDYAVSTIEDLWPKADLESALNLYCYNLETCWWENKGGKFVRHALPSPVQVSPVMGILAEDFNGDGKTDLLMAGNKYGFEVETGHCDAGIGSLLTGDGKGNFSWQSNVSTGFWASKEVRDLAVLRSKNGRIVVVANNNGPLQLYQIK
jgi:hypothetical protein